MKYSRRDVRRKAFAIPQLRFESELLSSFSGLVIVQRLFDRIRLRQRLSRCFRHIGVGSIYDRTSLFMQLVIHLILGYRELNHARYYADDPLVRRVLGLKKMPDATSIGRMLKNVDERSVEKLREVLTQMLLERLKTLKLARVTLDFDGSVQSTSRRAEGTAVGFNKKKKGARSYYPLFCTLAQTSQVFDFLHRSGNVHDSRGAREFILACIQRVRESLPATVTLEVRMDSAFFSDEIVDALREAKVEFTISVPFERFASLKRMVQQRRRWRRLDRQTSFFEASWKPECWDRRSRFLFIRTRAKKQQKGPVQLDLFVPHERGYEFKVIVTNKTTTTRSVVAYHEGRGAQEKIFGELKTHAGVDYIPVKRRAGNQVYLLAGLFAHNLIRELQMETASPTYATSPNRAPLWSFETMDTIRKTLIQRAGRLTRPNGALTLTISAAGKVKRRFLETLDRLSV